MQQIEDEIEKDIDRLNEFGDELRRLGVEMKDPVAGLVDFLTQIDGREAYLCWKLGEGEIAFLARTQRRFRRTAIAPRNVDGRPETGRPGPTLVSDVRASGNEQAPFTLNGRR